MNDILQVKDFRQLYSKVISDKHDDVMAKFGAILAQGIIDAGNDSYVYEQHVFFFWGGDNICRCQFPLIHLHFAYSHLRKVMHSVKM